MRVIYASFNAADAWNLQSVEVSARRLPNHLYLKRVKLERATETEVWGYPMHKP